MELKKQTLGSLREMLDTKQISAAELCKEYSDSIKAKDSDVLGYITVTEDEALKNAEKAQEIIDKGEAKALTGIPLAIKDNICTDGIQSPHHLRQIHAGGGPGAKSRFNMQNVLLAVKCTVVTPATFL